KNRNNNRNKNRNRNRNRNSYKNKNSFFFSTSQGTLFSELEIPLEHESRSLVQLTNIFLSELTRNNSRVYPIPIENAEKFAKELVKVEQKHCQVGAVVVVVVGCCCC